MTTKYKILRKFKLRTKQKKSLSNFGVVALTMLVVIPFGLSMINKSLSTDTASLRPLLNLIATAESNANYNAYYGNASNIELRLTEMSIKEVQKWQAEYIEDGSPSSAAGRYQIIDTTLASLVTELNMDEDQIFDKSTQDKLAIALMERRGVNDYINKKLSAKQFAANLSKEWAALPRTMGKDPHSSYYASDGLNESRVSVAKVLEAVEIIEPEK